MSNRKLSLQLWRLQRLAKIQHALRPSGLLPQHTVSPFIVCGRRGYARKADNDFSVREFVRESPKSKKLVEIPTDVENKVEADLLRSEVDQLRKEIQTLQEGQFGPNSKFMKSLPDDLRARVQKALEEHGDTTPLDLDIDEDIDDEYFNKILQGIDPDDGTPLNHNEDKLAGVPGVSLSLPQKSKAYVTKFNQALQKAAEDGLQKIGPQRELWKAYIGCQGHVTGFSEMISDEVWDVLWFSQSELPEKAKNIPLLAQDILGGGHLLTARQWIEYLQCLHSSGSSVEALSKWEEAREVLDAEEDSKADSLYLGIRLYAANGLPNKALKLASDISIPYVPASILVKVITAFAMDKSPQSSEKAWTLYLKMKAHRSNELGTEHYEDISTSLLNADKPELALAVFKDMVLHKRESKNDSLAVYKAAHGYFQDLQDSKISEEEINRVSLSALTVLPRSFQNKYFYASWIKKLIGLGHYDAAATVVELMYVRGIRPDAKHLNGIVGAWFRRGSDESRKKAESMAWSMIDKRIEFVDERINRTWGKPTSDTLLLENKYVAVARPVPPATIETFSILLQSYLNRRKTGKAEHLMSSLASAELRPDTFIMNQWLGSHLRHNRPDAAWQSYLSYRTNSVRADLETFACLWDCAKVQYEVHQGIDPPHFPRARDLFAEMKSWLGGLSPRQMPGVKDQFSRDLYDQLIRSFCLSHDLRGILCAMHGIQKEIGMLPDTNTARMILLSVGRHLGADDVQSSANVKGTSRRLSRRRRTSNPTASLSKVTVLMNAVADRKAAKMFGQGVDVEHIAEQTKAGIQLQILTEFILIILARNVPTGSQTSSRSEIDEHIQRVAASMRIKSIEIAWDDIEDQI